MSLRDVSVEEGRGSVPVGGRPLTIGLVNLMPDATFIATESQFRQLLTAGATRAAFQLKLFTLPSLARAGSVLDYANARYETTEQLYEQSLDGLIITGTEPKQADLRREPYWADMTRLIDWAAINTASTIFSCLVAHVAVLHLDGVERRRMPGKLTGVMACAKTGQHWLTDGAPEVWHTPHSRWNDVSEADLTAHGYQVLVRSEVAGADLFVKTVGSRFVFLQGHPEYDGDSLQKEYRRDVRRFLTGESQAHPSLPANVFAPEVAEQLQELAQRAIATRDEGVYDAVSRLALAGPVAPHWRPDAVRLYRNWLSHLSDREHAATLTADLVAPL